MQFVKSSKRIHPLFLADSAEQIAASIDRRGLRGMLEHAFQAATTRAKGQQQKSSEGAINETREVEGGE